MSTLTKILIVLLTISSIFLCGIVVTYVANADNYKTKYEDLKRERDGFKEKVNSLTEQLKNKSIEAERLDEKRRKEVALLNEEINKAISNLKNTQTENAELLHRVSSLVSVVETANRTANNQTELFQNTQKELEAVKTEQINDRKKLDDTTNQLLEKMAAIEALDVEKRRLLEDRTALQGKLDQLLKPVGREVVVSAPVTPEKTQVKPVEKVAEAATRDINLDGLVRKVDMPNSLVEISLGKTDGVTEGMKFYVTRGDEFICEIEISNVDTEKAVGAMKLIQQEPKTGDKVSTNL